MSWLTDLVKSINPVSGTMSGSTATKMTPREIESRKLSQTLAGPKGQEQTYYIPFNGEQFTVTARSQADAVNQLAKELNLGYTPNVKVSTTPIQDNQVNDGGQDWSSIYNQISGNNNLLAANAAALAGNYGYSAADMENAIADAQQTAWEEATKATQTWLDEIKKTIPENAPVFAFDEAVAKEQVSQEYSPYYKSLLDDYTKDFNVNKQETLGGVSRRLEDITSNEEYRKKTVERDLRDAIDRSEQSLAGRGLAYSGIRGQEKNAIEVPVKDALAQFLQEQNRTREEMLRGVGSTYGGSALDQFRDKLTGNPLLDKLVGEYGNTEGTANTALNRYAKEVEQQKKSAINQGVTNRYNEAYNQFITGKLQPYYEQYGKQYGSLLGSLK